MAKAKKKVTKKKTVKKAVKKAVKKKFGKRVKSPPAYFLSLSVENVRCFGPKQTIDLSDGKGKPSQWTVILGDNNTGKTTLLQSLVAMEPSYILPNSDGREGPLLPAILGFNLLLSVPSSWKLHIKLNLRKCDSKGSVCIAYVAYLGGKLNEPTNKGSASSFSLQMSFSEEGYTTGSVFQGDVKQDKVGGLVCYGYGASRKMGETSLGEKSYDSKSVFSLFYVSLICINK